MVTKQTQAALDGTTKRAHATDPKAPPNRKTIGVMNRERTLAGMSPQLPPLSHDIASEPLTHAERAQAVEREAAKSRATVRKTQDNRAPKA